MTMTDPTLASDGDLIDPPERVPVEVMDRPAGPGVQLPPETTGATLATVGPPERTVADSNLERAAEAAMAMPGLPGRDEFLMLAVQARLISMSAGAPAAVRNNPHLAFHMAMLGRDLGISVTAAIEQIDVIGYKPAAKTYEEQYADVQLSISPELLNGQIRRLGLGSIRPKFRDAERCVAVAVTPDGEELGETEFTWKEAIQAGLVDPRCEDAFAHWAKPNVPAGDAWKQENRCRCRQGWRTYPRRMLWWRAAGYAASDYFPEASIGLYSPEELGAVVDADGRPIDPATVELPEGYEPPELPPAPADPLDDPLFPAEGTVADDLASEVRAMTARLAAIKAAGEDPAEQLRQLWVEQHEDGARKTPPWGHERFRRRHLTRARAITKSVEDTIKRGQFGDEVKQVWATATAGGAGFGPGTLPPEGQDFQAGAGKTPQQLARERRARETSVAVGASETAEGSSAPSEPPAAAEATQERAETEGQPVEPTLVCTGCGEPFAVTASGKPSTGAMGRSVDWPNYHRGCEPF